MATKARVLAPDYRLDSVNGSFRLKTEDKGTTQLNLNDLSKKLHALGHTTQYDPKEKSPAMKVTLKGRYTGTIRVYQSGKCTYLGGKNKYRKDKNSPAVDRPISVELAHASVKAFVRVLAMPPDKKGCGLKLQKPNAIQMKVTSMMATSKLFLPETGECAKGISEGPDGPTYTAVDLEAFADATAGLDSKFDPEVKNAVTIPWKMPQVTTLIHRTGNVTVVGAVSEADIRVALERVVAFAPGSLVEA